MTPDEHATKLHRWADDLTADGSSAYEREMATDLRAAADLIESQAARIADVLALHPQMKRSKDPLMPKWCITCSVEAPCPTRRTLTEET